MKPKSLHECQSASYRAFTHFLNQPTHRCYGIGLSAPREEQTPFFICGSLCFSKEAGSRERIALEVSKHRCWDRNLAGHGEFGGYARSGPYGEQVDAWRKRVFSRRIQGTYGQRGNGAYSRAGEEACAEHQMQFFDLMLRRISQQVGHVLSAKR